MMRVGHLVVHNHVVLTAFELLHHQPIGGTVGVGVDFRQAAGHFSVGVDPDVFHVGRSCFLSEGHWVVPCCNTSRVQVMMVGDTESRRPTGERVL